MSIIVILVISLLVIASIFLIIYFRKFKKVEKQLNYELNYVNTGKSTIKGNYLGVEGETVNDTKLYDI